MRCDEPIMDAKDLACYITNYCKENQGKILISDIWLQKSMYFLFAYWGKFIELGRKDDNYELYGLSNNLFKNEIQAWTYGPVIPDVYFMRKNNFFESYYINKYLGDENLFAENELLKSVIDGLLNDLVKIDPFKLVTLSHNDKSWQEKYNDEDSNHINIMDKESIINEYVSRNNKK